MMSRTVSCAAVATALAALLAACGASKGATPTAGVAVPRSSAPPLPPTPHSKPRVDGPLPVACERETLELDPPLLSADIACHPDCPRAGTPIPFRVVNCTKHPVLLDSYGRPEEWRTPLSMEGKFEEPIEPGTSAPFQMMVQGPGKGLVRVAFLPRGEPEAAPRTLGLTIEIRDSKLAALSAECTGRGDFWGPRGMAGSEQCWKVMQDDGKPCGDRRDCEGDCVLDSEVVVSATEKRVSGHCSRFKGELGCATRIGETRGGLMPRNTSFPRMCAD